MRERENLKLQSKTMKTHSSVKQIETKIVANFTKIMDCFGLDLEENNRFFVGSCPVHGGDNLTAFNFYHQGESYSGNWQCHTRQCEETFVSSPIGLIRGLLSRAKLNWDTPGDEIVSFADTLSWCESFFGCKVSQEINTYSEDDSLTRCINYAYNDLKIPYSFKISSQAFKDKVQIPSKYFINRGFSPETITTFGVGQCSAPGKPMNGRAVVPVYDIDGQSVIACSGRSIYAKCELCKGFHSDLMPCPNPKYARALSKWKHSPNFPGEHMLYNYHNAAPEIKKSGIAILVEGCPNVWKLWEPGFKMGLPPFRAKFSEHQKKLLDTTGAVAIIIVPDAGEAGSKMVKSIEKQCQHSYNIYTIKPDYEDDIAECNIEKIQRLVGPVIERFTSGN